MKLDISAENKQKTNERHSTSWFSTKYLIVLFVSYTIYTISMFYLGEPWIDHESTIQCDFTETSEYL